MYDENPELGPWGSDVDLSGPLSARAVLGCRAALPAIADAVTGCRDDWDPAVRAEAARIEVLIGRVPGSHGQRRDLLDLLRAKARDRGRSVDERCAAVLSIVEAGADPSEFLGDPLLPVRACAALSDRLASDPVAFGALIEALRHPAAIDGWFSDQPGHFRSRPRFELVRVAIARAGSFADLVDAAVAVAAVSSHYCVDDEWGPLLQAAFPDGRQPGTPLDPHQRRYLEALVANPDLWHPIGNASHWFHPLQLEHDRDEVRAVLATSGEG